MKIQIVTMFPEMFGSFLQGPVLRRAVRKGALEIEIVDLKSYAPGSFRHIDDSPFGGGRGMVMRCQPVIDALRAVAPAVNGGEAASGDGNHLFAGSCEGAAGNQTRPAAPDEKESAMTESAMKGAESEPAAGESRIVALTPAGSVFCQKKARDFAQISHLVLVCGHYEGMDERIYRFVDEELSIGDYVLTGGEPAAMVVADAVVRLLPDVLREGSADEESFENGLLEYPQYTQPADYDGMKVPDVLLSGNHALIRRWRRKESLRRTLERRPELLAKAELSEEDEEILRELKMGENLKGGIFPPR